MKESVPGSVFLKSLVNLGLVKVLDKGQWRDALQVGKQEGMSGASLGSEGNAIIPQPHPAGVKTHGHLGKILSTHRNHRNVGKEGEIVK